MTEWYRAAGAFALALFLAACTHEGDSDQLAVAERNLKPAPCGAAPAVAAGW